MTRKVFFTVGADGRTVATAAHPDRDPDDDTPGAELAATVAADYRSRWGADAVLDVFTGQNGLRYLFDSSPAGRTDLDRPANRVLAAWGYSAPDQRVGDRSQLRRFPLPPNTGRALDRGHLIAMAAGGGENVNIVPQASKLNRGHSPDGKRWRDLERHCAAHPGIFMLLSVEYDDLTDIPARFEFRIIDTDGTTRRERFTNRDEPELPDRGNP